MGLSMAEKKAVTKSSWQLQVKLDEHQLESGSGRFAIDLSLMRGTSGRVSLG